MKKRIIFTVIIMTVFSTVAFSQAIKKNFETGRKAFYSDDFDTANKLFSEILNMDSDSYEVCFYKGMIYYIYFDYDKSVIEFSKAIEHEAKSDAYFNRALSYEKLQKTNDAINDYTNAISTNKKNADAYFNRAALYQEQKNYDRAISDYGKVIKINPKDDITYYYRGMLYIQKGDKSSAIKDFEKAIEIDKIWKNELTKKIEELKK